MVFGVRNGRLDLSNSFIDESVAHDFMLMYERLVQETWSDPALRTRLIENPEEVFAERGFDTSELKEHGISIQMFETQLYAPGEEPVIIPLPRKPDAQIISEEELSSISGGSSSTGTTSTAATASCPLGSASSTGSCGAPPSKQTQSTIMHVAAKLEGVE